MTANIESLSSFGERFTIKSPKRERALAFQFKPHTLTLIGKINNEFKTDEDVEGYNLAMKKISELDFKVASKFIWLCLEKKPSEFNEYEKFEDFLLNEVNDMELVFKLVGFARETMMPDFTYEKTDKKKVMIGSLIIILAMIGMTNMLFWLYEQASPIKSFLISLLSKFSV